MDTTEPVVETSLCTTSTSSPKSGSPTRAMEQHFKRETRRQLLQVNFCQTTLKKFMYGVDPPKKKRLPGQGARTSTSSGTDSDESVTHPRLLPNVFTEPEKRMLAPEVYDWQLPYSWKFARRRLKKSSSNRVIEENGAKVTSVSLEQIEGLENTKAGTISATPQLAGDERVKPALPMTPIRLRQKLLQVVDPALKYSKFPTVSSSSCNSSGNGFISSQIPNGSRDEDCSLPAAQLPSRLCPADRGSIKSAYPTCISIDAPESTFEVPSTGLARVNTKPTKHSQKFAVDVLPGLGYPFTFDGGEENVITPWWSIPPEMTAIGRALGAIRRAEHEQGPAGNRPMLNTAINSNSTCDREQGLETKSPISIPTGDCQSKKQSRGPAYHANYLQAGLAKLTRRIRTKIWLLVIGVQYHFDNASTATNCQISRIGIIRDKHEGCSGSREFLKLTASEKKAFYSSVGMNRIASSCGNDVHNMPEARLLEGTETSSWTTLTSPEMLESWCRVQSLPGGQHSRHVNVILWEPLFGQTNFAFELAQHGIDSDRGDELLRIRRAITSVEEKMSDVEQLCSAWTLAMRQLPVWITELQIKATVPHWMDRRELEIFLARIKSYALFKTKGTVRWVVNVERDCACAEAADNAGGQSA